MTLSIGTLVGYLQLDDTQFNRKASAADKKIDGLKLHLDALGKTNPKISVEVLTQTKKLEELQAHIAELKAQAAKGVNVNVDMVAALVKLDALQAKIRSMHNAEIKVHVDDKGALAKLDAIQKYVDGFGSKGGLFGSALAFSPALLPAINALPGGLFAIGSGAVASAGGIGVLALAFNGLGDAVKAYKKYEAELPFAKNAKQVAALKKTLSLSAYGDQNGPARDFTRTVVTEGGPAGTRIKRAAQAGVFPGATKALHDIMPLVPVISRLMRSLGNTVGEMTDRTAKALNSPFWRQWFKWLGQDARTQLPLVGSIFGNFFKGIMQGIQRFSPQGTSLLKWIDDLAKRFANWTGSAAFDQFMATTSQNATLVGHALQAVAPILADLYKGFSATGSVELQLFTGAMQLLAHLPTEAIRFIGATLPIIFIGLKAIGLTSSITSGIRSLGGAFGFMRAEMTASQTAVAGLSGVAGMALLATSTQQSSKEIAALTGALGGAATGFAMTGTPIGALIGGVGGGLLGIFAAAHKAKSATTGAGDAAMNSVSQWATLRDTLDGVAASSTKATRAGVIANLNLKTGKDGKGPSMFDRTRGLGLGDNMVVRAMLHEGKARDTVTAAIKRQEQALRDAADAQKAAIDKQAAISAAASPRSGPAISASVMSQKKALDEATASQIANLDAIKAGLGFQDQQAAAQQHDNALLRDFIGLRRQLREVGKPGAAKFVRDHGLEANLTSVTNLIKMFHIIDGKTVNAIVKASGIPLTKANLAAVQAAVDLLKKQHPVIPVDADTHLARNKIDSLRTLLNNLLGGTHTIKVGATSLPGLMTPMSPGGGKGKRAGGTISGQRMPYGDKVLTPTAPGEEIISNDRGQADMNRPALKAANAGAVIAVVSRGYAGGGTVDPLAGFGPEDVPGTEHHHKKRRRRHGMTRAQKLRAQLAAENKALAQTKSMLSDAQEWSSGFAGNAFSADLSAYMPKSAPVTSIVNGMRVTQSGSTAARTPQSILTAMLAYQDAQKVQAKNLAVWVAKLRKEGVSKSVLEQMKNAGPEGIAEIQALASGTPEQVKKFNASNVATMASLNNTGALATSGHAYSALQKQQLAEQAIIRGLNHALKKPVPVRVISGNLRP